MSEQFERHLFTAEKKIIPKFLPGVGDITNNNSQCLRFKSHSKAYQLLQHVTERDRDIRYALCCDFISRTDDNEIFPSKVVFSEATLRLFIWRC
jgi:hypothetical protein